MNALLKFFPLVKVEEATRTAYGLVTAEAPDKEGEICDYDSAKAAYTKWSNEFMAKTTAAGQEPSLGNIRVQHQLEVGGKVTRLEFKDAEKQVWLATTPASDEVWGLLKGGFLTGFSQGGSYLWKKEDGQYTRYGLEISEVSYVDNPCLGQATFSYVKADGSMELRKLKGAVVEKTEPRTKTVDGVSLPSRCFAYVGDEEKTETWKLPIEFPGDEEKTKSHIRNALARFDQTEGIPEGEKAKVKAKIEAAAHAHGIDVSEKSESAEFRKLAAQLESVIELIKSGGAMTDLEKARKDLHGHLAALKAAHEAHKEATDKHHAKVADCIEKCMKAVGGEGEQEAEGPGKASGGDPDFDAKLAAAVEKALAAHLEKSAVRGVIVRRDGDPGGATALDPAFADLTAVE